MKQWAFIIDVEKCEDCNNCFLACKDEHVGNEWKEYTHSQPLHGHRWINIFRKERGQYPLIDVAYLPVPCMHCDNAPCIKAAENNAVVKREDGIVMIDYAKAAGQKEILKACPYDAIYFNEALNIAQKCTGCAHLLDDEWEVPRCVDQCPTGALKFGEETELKELINKAEPLNPDTGIKTRVHYLNLPKKFIAGTLYDPVENEVIINAVCTLTDSEDNETFTVDTDNFGDFWFRGLKDDRTFSLRIEKNGKSLDFDGISTAEDVNLGDIPLG